MQLVGSKASQRLDEIGEGSVTLLPVEPEDMVSQLDQSQQEQCATPNAFPQWHAYNLIRPEDLLRASAVRKVVMTESASGSKSGRKSERVPMTLTIRVHKLDFDPQAGQLHVSGRILQASSALVAVF